MESKKYANYYFREFGRNRIGYVTLFVTSKCNARCGHCFYWQSLNKDDLKLSEIKKIFSKLGQFSVLLLSGGEPFLRKDLIEICRYIADTNGVIEIIIPTNGIQTEHIIETTRLLCWAMPDVLFSVNPSIDGLWATHDSIRGTHCWFNAIHTTEQLAALKQKIPNLQITVNSVLSNKNIDEMPDLMGFLQGYRITNHNIELLRGDPKDKEFALPSIEKIKEIHRLAAYNKYRKIKNTGWQNQMVMLGSLVYQQKLQQQVVQGKKLPYVCQAGRSIIVIYANGDVAPCELTAPVANLRDHNYDVKAIMNTRAWQARLELIRQEHCSCTHICYLNASLAKEPATLFKIPYHWCTYG